MPTSSQAKKAHQTSYNRSSDEYPLPSIEKAVSGETASTYESHYSSVTSVHSQDYDELSPCSNSSQCSARLERLHEYGRVKMERRRDLEKKKKRETSTREASLKSRLEMKQQKMRQQVGKIAPIKRGKRIHDSYAQKKNEAGRKLREEIEKKNQMKAEQRKADWK